MTSTWAAQGLLSICTDVSYCQVASSVPIRPYSDETVPRHSCQSASKAEQGRMSGTDSHRQAIMPECLEYNITPLKSVIKSDVCVIARIFVLMKRKLHSSSLSWQLNPILTT